MTIHYNFADFLHAHCRGHGASSLLGQEVARIHSTRRLLDPKYFPLPLTLDELFLAVPASGRLACLESVRELMHFWLQQLPSFEAKVAGPAVNVGVPFGGWQP